MSRVFAHAQVSAPDQTTGSQVNEIAGAGFTVQPRRMVRDIISGSVRAFQRPKFECLEERDILVSSSSTGPAATRWTC